MGLPKGKTNNPKGRPKGITHVVHGADEYRSVRQQLRELGFDTVIELVNIARNDNYDIRVRKSAIKDLFDKSYPDLKSIDITAEEGIKTDIEGIKEHLAILITKHKKDY